MLAETCTGQRLQSDPTRLYSFPVSQRGGDCGRFHAAVSVVAARCCMSGCQRQLVKKGQLLIQLDDAQAQLDHDWAAAAFKMAQAQLQKALR